MNKSKKILVIILMMFILFGSFSTVFAKEINTTLDVIEMASETQYLENNQGYISKTIVDKKSEEGEVTIELKLTNEKKVMETIASTEIFLVVDNSPSMDFVTSTGETRKELVLNSAYKLVESIFNNSANVKIGLIDFHGYSLFEGASKYNATVKQKLTDDKEAILNAIESELSKSTSNGTNIEAGLKMAQKNFSASASNKIIILLTDGLPNADTEGNHSTNDVTTETNVLIATNTKNTLLELKKEKIYTITLLTGMSESDGNTDKNGTVYEEPNTIEEQLAAAEYIFGTKTNPTADQYYLVSNLDISETITEDIFQAVINKVQSPINTVKIVDYFPEDITEHFEFSYVEEPTVGTVSESIDEETKTITWDIGTLKGGEVATLKYKLKIKDMENTELLNKTIATNEKVVLTYEDTEKDYTVTLESSPKIRLSQVIEELTATVSYDPTTNTTEKVTATIKTNKKINEVKGWTLSEDRKTLTKEYSENTTEMVHLVDEDNMTKDVEIIISNIIIKDTTIANEEIPKAGEKAAITIATMFVILISGIYTFTKYRKLREI